MFLKEQFSKRTIIQLRWALMISIAYNVAFSHSVGSTSVIFYLLLFLYALTWGVQKQPMKGNFVAQDLDLTLSPPPTEGFIPVHHA